MWISSFGGTHEDMDSGDGMASGVVQQVAHDLPDGMLREHGLLVGEVEDVEVDPQTPGTHPRDLGGAERCDVSAVCDMDVALVEAG